MIDKVIKNDVISIISKVLNIKEEEIPMQIPLSTLGAEEIELIAIAYDLNEELQINLTTHELTKVETVQDIINLVINK